MRENKKKADVRGIMVTKLTLMLFEQIKRILQSNSLLLRRSNTVRGSVMTGYWERKRSKNSCLFDREK